MHPFLRGEEGTGRGRVPWAAQQGRLQRRGPERAVWEAGGSACFLGNWPFPILSLVRLLRWWEPTDVPGGGLPGVGGA